MENIKTSEVIDWASNFMSRALNEIREVERKEQKQIRCSGSESE